jgi:SNF2 family DNA or RNA helicase
MLIASGNGEVGGTQLPPVYDYLSFDKAYGFAEKAGFQLSPLQIQDTNTFAEWNVCLNRYEVGGGKTVVSSAVALMRDAEVILVLVPPILIRPWVRWLRKVSDNVLQYQESKDARAQLDLDSARWIVCSHTIFRKDFRRIERSLARRKTREIIVDEAQYMKNVQTKLFERVEQIASGQFLQMLTGTPTSTPMDSYAYIKLMKPEAYRNMTHFEMLHVGKKDFFKKVTGWKNLDLIKTHFDHRSIRRTKQELHGYKNDPLFPDCSYVLAPEHQALYEKLVEEQLLLLPDGTKIDASTAIRLYHNMQQIIVNYDVFSGIEGARSAAHDLLDMTMDMTECNKPGRSKLMVWTMYKMTSRNMLAYLRREKVNAVAAYGEVNSQDSFDRFMDDDSVRVLVAQYQSAGAGLNPQSVCWESVFLETSTSTMHNTQAMGRIDRMGQQNVPSQRYFRAENTIQASLLLRLANNEKLVAEIEGTKAQLRDILLGR